MAFTYLRHQLHLHRHKITVFLFLALLGAGQQTLAQGKLHGENLPGYEFKRLRWGFSLGVNGSWYQLEHSQYYVDRIDEGYSVNDKTGIGFNVNFITTYRLSPNFVLRAQPGVGYHSRLIEYKNVPADDITPGGDITQQMNTFAGELPLLVKYEAKRRKNTQMYFIAGIKPSLVVGGQKKGNPEVLQVKSMDFAIEYGVGLDMFYPFFKFAPEIRYSRGISNVHQPFPTVFNNSIQQLNTNTVTLYLNFE
ncbi:type IX secretion/gliding motility protein PorT/SprT [Rufibacter latericius]|uniref:PorT family protein n=1 Tax=Rufibacter latericius TaxID=2487040 RepID=A0A3M9N1G5_9BACT|nr:porin family protein [Rufibacter latericius]RNI31187.1 PorT family protein [Rufibacter latericius]